MNTTPTEQHPRRRASLNEMRDAALRLDCSVGTDSAGNVISFGTWNWPREYDVPAPGPLASAQERADIIAASGLVARQLPQTVFEAFLAARRAIAEAATGEAELRTEGYTAQALTKACAALGKRIVEDTLDDHVARAHKCAVIVEDTLLSLGAKRADDDADADQTARVQRALVDAAHDVAIAQALKPLTAAESAMLRDRRVLPKQLDDQRVLDACRAVPRALLPFSADELAAILELGTARRWPHTVRIATDLREALDETQRTAALALSMIGRLLHPTEPSKVFTDVAGGLWAAIPVAAREDFRDTQFGPQLREMLRPYHQVSDAAAARWSIPARALPQPRVSV